MSGIGSSKGGGGGWTKDPEGSMNNTDLYRITRPLSIRLRMGIIDMLNAIWEASGKMKLTLVPVLNGSPKVMQTMDSEVLQLLRGSIMDKTDDEIITVLKIFR